MCQEFNCECCPDDLPQISCVCVDCHHGAEGSDSQTEKRPDQLNTDKAGAAKEDFQSEMKNHQIPLSEEECCGGGVDANLDETQKKPCCSQTGDGKSTNGSKHSQADRICCTREDDEHISQDGVQQVSPCCSSGQKMSNAKTRSAKETGDCSQVRSTNGDSSASELEENRSCCSSKKPEDGKCEKGPQKVPCCSSAQESDPSNESQQKDSCCSSKKTGVALDQCCRSPQEVVSEETKKLNLEDNQCCTAGKSNDICQNYPPQNAVKCCSSERECSSKGTCELERKDISCPIKKNQPEDKQEQNGDSCCSNDSTLPKDENCEPVKQSGSTCCSASVPSSCKDSSKDEIESLPAAENSCCATQEDNCCAKDEESSTDNAYSTKEETVLLIEPDETTTALKQSNLQPVRKNITKLRVQNICCAMEAQLVEECLKPLEGVDSVAVNVIGRVAHVRHDPEVISPTALVNCLNRVHLGATVMEMGAHSDKDNEKMPRLLKLSIIYVLIQAALLVSAVVGLFLKQSWYQWVAIAEMIFGGVPILKHSFIAAKNRRIDINILMLIAIIGTIAISEWVEGATVVFVFAVSDVLQNFCMHRVQRTISKLMLKRPEIAVLVETGESVPIEDVAIGTLIAVRPGELIPLDGVVVKGRAAVDESSITGESLPVEKTVTSKVYSGTVNQNGYIEVETTSDSSSSTVSKVAQMVQEAQSSSTKTEAMINRFAKYYTPLVVIIAALLVIFPAILGAAGVGTYLKDIREWGRRALVMLVIACPCALVMATPIAIVTSVTAAARKGALVKGGEYLETLSRLKILAFDKTGTLTEGKFQVTNMESEGGGNKRDILRLAAGLESKTVHPISAAIVNEFSGCVAEMVKNQTVTLPEVTQFRMYEGQGISGLIEGKLVRVGNLEMIQKCGASLSEYMSSKYHSWSSDSKTVVFVCVDEKVSLMIGLADAIRPNTSLSLDWLRDLGVQTCMITGDNSKTADAVKDKLSVDDCMSEMKPHDKLDWIKERQLCPVFEQASHSYICCRKPRAKHVIVGMVGDGVNDGPALATANVGIAMGAGGTALAVEAADVALMSNNLAKIPELITLAKFCIRIIMQNIFVSVLLKVVIVIVALCGYVTLWMAVVADVVGLLAVILNGLRPLSWKPHNLQRKTTLDTELVLKKNVKSSYSYESIV